MRTWRLAVTTLGAGAAALAFAAGAGAQSPGPGPVELVPVEPKVEITAAEPDPAADTVHVAGSVGFAPGDGPTVPPGEPGTVDETYAEDGTSRISDPDDGVAVKDIEVLEDDSVVAASDLGDDDVLVSRLDSAGKDEVTSATTVSFPDLSFRSVDIEVSDAGWAYAGVDVSDNASGITAAGVGRIGADGILDPGYGPGGGIVILDYEPDIRLGAIQPVADDLVVALSVPDSGLITSSFVRLDSTGNALPGWGFGFGFGQSTVVNDMQMRASDGLIIGTGTVVGSDASDSGYLVFALDPATGMFSDGYSNGFFTDPLTDCIFIGNALDLQADGKALIAGAATACDNVPGTSGFVTRQLADGAIDLGFAAPLGAIQLPVPGSAVVGRDVVVQPDGRIVWTGTVTATGGAQSAFLSRLQSDALVDPDFGDDGVEYTKLPGGNTGNNALGLQRNGRILTGGYESRAGRSAVGTVTGWEAYGIRTLTVGFMGGDRVPVDWNAAGLWYVDLALHGRRAGTVVAEAKSLAGSTASDSASFAIGPIRRPIEELPVGGGQELVRESTLPFTGAATGASVVLAGLAFLVAGVCFVVLPRRHPVFRGRRPSGEARDPTLGAEAAQLPIEEPHGKTEQR